jgi:RHS repeat-associated protein
MFISNINYFIRKSPSFSTYYKLSRTPMIHYYHYDGLGSTRTLTDKNATVTDVYSYEAFGKLLEQTGSTENDYLYAGEQIDRHLNQYYLRARYYDQGIGRFTQMDTWQGRAREPITLHKYLYTHADPINNVDPSGNNVSIGSISAATSILNNSLLTLSMRIGYLINAYHKVQAVAGFYELLTAVRQVMGQATSFTEADASRSGIPSKNEVDLEEALESAAFNIPKAIGVGITYWARGYMKTQKTSKITGFLLYMPLLTSGPEGVVPVPTPAKVRFASRKVPIKIVFGGPKKAYGSLIGIGVQMGSNRQLVRMDYHEWRDGHGGSKGKRGNEIRVWTDGNYHYHVMTWGAGNK